MKHNHQPFEHYEERDHINLYLGIALGVLITFCLGVYVVTSVIAVLNMPIV